MSDILTREDTMDRTEITSHRKLYESMLFDDVVKFWLDHSLDREHGGYLHMLDREGRPYSTDKYAWPHGREAWFFATLCDEVEQREEWYEAAKLGWEFITRHFIGPGNRVFFSVTRDGRPLTMPRRIFSECFVIIAAVRWSRISGDEEAADIARTLFRETVERSTTSGAGSQKAVPGARPMITMAIPMIMMNVTRELMKLDGETQELLAYSDACLETFLTRHVHPERRLAFENVAPDGSLMLDIPEGRQLIPGHAIEGAWFVMEEGIARRDQGLIDRACELLEWELEFGWDTEYGGLFYFMDSEGKPPLPLESDMKLWWCHNETLIALLYALTVKDHSRFERWYRKVHDYTFSTFPDPEYGEWFGYFHRDGSIALPVKGSAWKGCFHVPRHLLNGWRLLSGLERTAGNPV